VYKDKNVLALIPARGKSKELPRKNIIPLLDKPLIAWTIEQAKESKYVDRVVVSTEDKEIAEISKKYGAEVPFMRPKRLSSDRTKGIEVVLHAIEFFKNRLANNFILLYLQPTSPLRSAEDIDKATEQLGKRCAKAIISVCECEYHPYLANRLPRDGNMKNFLKENIANKNRQDFPKYYRLNGAIYAGYIDYIKEKRGFFGESTYAYIMPAERSVDINNKMDLIFAEFLLERNRK